MACAVDPRMMDLVWTDRYEYEAVMHKRPACSQAEPSAAGGAATTTTSVTGSSVVAELEAARGFIRASLGAEKKPTTQETLLERATYLESSNKALKKLVEDLQKRIISMEGLVQGGAKVSAAAPTKAAAAAPAKKVEESDDDDFKFSDDEDEKDAAPKETEMQKMKRLAAEKKAEADNKAKNKKKPILKSNVILDVKPWDDETDMKELEKAVRGVEMEGLVWGSSKLVEIGFGIKKLQISTCIVDDLVGLYDLEDNISALEDFVQSVDIASHNKI